MTKRGHGEGTVYKDKMGHWWAKLPADDVGKRPKRKANPNTQRRALELLRDMMKERAAGRNLSLQSPTVEAFLNTWLVDTVKPSLKAKTHDTYALIVKNYLIPEIGRYRLDKLTPAQVQKLINDMQQRESVRTKKPISAHTARHTRRVLVQALNVAVAWGYLSRNVAALVKPPRVEHHKITPLTVEEAQRLLEAVVGDRIEALYHIAFCGPREGELLGLLWNDLDWEQRCIKVTGMVQYAGGELKRRTTTKTKSSTRTIPLSDEVIAKLRSHLANQQEEQALLGEEWKEHGLIFASGAGTPMWPRNLVRHFKKALQAASLPSTIRFHDLRHSAASLMLAQGTPLKVVSEILGHSSVAITGDIYGHAYDSSKRTAVENMGKALREKRNAE